MRDTTVEVSKLTEVKGRFYRGGQHVVTAEVAAALVKGGHAKILGGPIKDEAKSKKDGLSAEGDK